MARFKKGSKEAKDYMRKIRNSKSSNSSTKLIKNQKMAKRKIGKRKSYAKASSSNKPTNILIGGGLYGVGRSFVSDKISPLTSKIPLGDIADEVGMFGLSYFLNKKMKNKTLKNIGLAGMFIESAMIGQAVQKGSIFPTLSTNSSSSLNANIF